MKVLLLTVTIANEKPLLCSLDLPSLKLKLRKRSQDNAFDSSIDGNNLMATLYFNEQT